MPIESVWMSALDRRKDLAEKTAFEVSEYTGLPVNVFWSGDGKNPSIEYDRVDLPASPELFKCCIYGNGQGRINHANAFLSHRDMFKKILSEGYNNALILEEDIYIIPDRWNTIYNSEIVQNFINDGDWDALYLGWQQKEYPADTDELTRVEYAWEDHRSYNIERARPIFIPISGLHAVLLKRSMIERLAKLEQGPVDSFLNRNLERFKLYYIAPKIIGALDSYSEAECRHQPRKHLV